MEKLIFSLWGCFFGVTLGILVGAWLAFMHSLRRISLNAVLTALLSAFFAIAFLDGLPISDANTLARFLGHLTTLFAGFLTYQLLVTLALLRTPEKRERAALGLTTICAVIFGMNWATHAWQSPAHNTAFSCLLAAFALAVSIGNGWLEERMAWAIESRLRRSAALNTSQKVSPLGGLMVANAWVRGFIAIDIGQRLSRTAVSYASRIVWFDHSSGETVALPKLKAV